MNYKSLNSNFYSPQTVSKNTFCGPYLGFIISGVLTVSLSGCFIHSSSSNGNLPQPSTDIELRSERGVDYAKLRELLASGKWKEADEETWRMIEIVARNPKTNASTIDDIIEFPCEDLRTMDKLWVKYSNGRFGFSAQNRIWESVWDNVKNPNENNMSKYPAEVQLYIFHQFSDRVGWRVNEKWLADDEIVFDYSAPEGHLPYLDGHFRPSSCGQIGPGFICHRMNLLFRAKAYPGDTKLGCLQQ